METTVLGQTREQDRKMKVGCFLVMLIVEELFMRLVFFVTRFDEENSFFTGSVGACLVMMGLTLLFCLSRPMNVVLHKEGFCNEEGKYFNWKDVKQFELENDDDSEMGLRSFLRFYFNDGTSTLITHLFGKKPEELASLFEGYMKHNSDLSSEGQSENHVKV
jgi:hypothetical protein